MSARTVIGASSGVAGGGDVRAMVFVDGVPEPRLIVREVSWLGRLDRREAHVVVDGSVAGGRSDDRWADAAVGVAVPLELSGGRVRWEVLVDGRFDRSFTELSGDGVGDEVTLVDSWAVALEREMQGLWWWTSQGLTFESQTGVRIGGESGWNRSAEMVLVDGRSVYVLQEGGERWTVGAALSMIDAVAGLGLSLALIPREIAGAPLVVTVGLDQPLSRILEEILEPYGLVVRRELRRDGGRVVERRAVRGLGTGRVVEVTWPAGGAPGGAALEVEDRWRHRRAELWVARADGWLVESTFALQGGWDPALDGESDVTYSKSGSSDFAVYADVFRLWVLNEDGAFSGQPYALGEAFDLGGFFESAGMRAQALRFESGLTLEGAGARRAPLVEFSTDSGANWGTYAGAAEIRADRAAVYLDDDVLDGAFLAAAKAGTARIRVTASLRSPDPVEERRWSGNPFQGTAVPNVHELGGRFRFQRVAETSINYAGVVGGVLAAGEADERIGLARWLGDQMRVNGAPGSRESGRARLRLAGANPMLRVGDRVVGRDGRGIGAHGAGRAGDARLVTVRSIRCRWSVGEQPDHGIVRAGRATLDQAPSTTVELAV